MLNVYDDMDALECRWVIECDCCYDTDVNDDMGVLSSVDWKNLTADVIQMMIMMMI